MKRYLPLAIIILVGGFVVASSVQKAISEVVGVYSKVPANLADLRSYHEHLVTMYDMMDSGVRPESGTLSGIAPKVDVTWEDMKELFLNKLWYEIRITKYALLVVERLEQLNQLKE